MKRDISRPGPRTTTILVAMVVGVVAIILCCCIVLFLDRYRSAMVQSARTGSAQTVSQVSSTVGNYLRDMDQAMELVVRSMSEPQQSRDELLSAFLQFRPDVVAVTSYSEAGELVECWSLGREPRKEIFQNLSFDLDTARASDGPYMSTPHVETIFEGYYPWVVTMTAPLEQGGEAAWVSLDLSFCQHLQPHQQCGHRPAGLLLFDGPHGEHYLPPPAAAAVCGAEVGGHRRPGRPGGRHLCGGYRDLCRHQRGGQRAGGWWASALWTSWSTATCGR